MDRFAVTGPHGEFVFEAGLVSQLSTDGRAQPVLTFSRDVKLRRQAEEQLRQQSSALQSADNASLITDAVGAIQWVNPAFTERRHLQSQLQRASRLEEWGSLAGGVTHDQNIIPSPILLTTGLFRSISEDPGSLEMASLIEANAKRGAEIVRQRLTLARRSAPGH